MKNFLNKNCLAIFLSWNMHSLVIWGEYETREGTIANGNAELGEIETIETIRAHENCDQTRVLIK